jgi:hypothetical protein
MDPERIGGSQVPKRGGAVWTLAEMAQAFVIATTKEDAGDRDPALWVVLADSPLMAVEAARASGCEVDRIVGTLSEETVERLGIQPDQARRL